jgi:hypothetical protein
MKKILAFFLILTFFTGCSCFKYGFIDRWGRICGQDSPQKEWNYEKDNERL